MFELYTECARRTIFHGRREALRYGSRLIETEHLLLGILCENEAVAKYLVGPTVSAIDLRKEIEAITTTGQPITEPTEVPLSADCKRILNLAVDEATALGHKQVCLGHLLLGILRVEKSIGATILQAHGVTIRWLRDHAIRDMRWADTPG